MGFTLISFFSSFELFGFSIYEQEFDLF